MSSDGIEVGQSAHALDQWHVRIFRTPSDLEALRDFWNSCRAGRDADLDFYLFFIGLNPEIERPHVIVLYHGDTPKALLVGRLETRRLPVKLGYFTVPVPKLRVLYFVHGGWLGDLCDANAERLIASVLNSLDAGEADTALLHYADVSSPLVRFARFLPRSICSDHLIDPQSRWFRQVSQTHESFLASLPKKERYHQRSRAKAIAQEFRSSTIERFETLDQLDRLMRDAEVVANKSYQRGLGVGFATTPVIRSRLEFEACKGWLRAYVLYLNGCPSAFWIGSLRNHVFLSDYLAFDPAFTKCAPGLYLTVQVMEELCGRLRDGAPVERIDFGIGDALYKERLSNCDRRESLVYIFAPSMKAIAVNALRTGAGLLNRSAKSLTIRIQVFGRIKRIWRSQLAKREG